MAMKQIYLGNGHLAGSTNDTGSQIQAFNNYGRYLGYYNKASKQTYDANGRPYQNGGLEALGFLIINNYKK